MKEQAISESITIKREAKEIKQNLAKEVSLLSSLFYSLLFTLFGVFALLLLEPTINSAYPLPQAQNFFDFFKQYMIDHPELPPIPNPSNSLVGLIQQIVTASADLLLYVVKAYMDYIKSTVVFSQGLQLQMGIHFAIELAIILLLYLVLYFKNMRLWSAVFGIVVGFIVAYLIFAVICKVIFSFFLFQTPDNYVVVSIALGLNGNWLDFNNMLTTVIMVKELLGIDWLYFWLIFMLIFNTISIIASFLFQRIVYPIVFPTNIHIKNPETLKAELDQKLSFYIFSFLLGSFILFGLRGITEFLVTAFVPYSAEEFLLIFLFLFISYYLNKWLLYEMYKFFFHSDASLIAIYQIKKESALQSLTACALYTIVMVVNFVAYMNSNWYSNLLIQWAITALVYVGIVLLTKVMFLAKK